MSERKNIEKLFQEKFENLEVSPDKIVWENIEAILQKKEKKRIIPFWWKLTGIAASLILGFFIFTNLSLFNNSNVIEGKKNTLDNNLENNYKNSVAVSKSNATKRDKSEGENKINSAINVAVASESNSEKSKLNSSKRKNSKVASKINSAINAAVASESNSEKSKLNSTIRNSSKDENKINNSINNAVASESNSEKSKLNSSKRKNAKVENKTNSEINAAVASESNSEKSKLNSTIRNSSKDENKINNSINNAVASQSDSDKTKSNAAIRNKSVENPIAQIENKKNIESKDIKKIDSMKIATVEPNALEELLHEKDKSSKTDTKINRWQVSSNLAPIYFNSAKNGSPLDAKLESNQKSYQTDKSYGLGLNYSVNKKVKIRAGLNVLSIAYQTAGVVYYQDENQVSKIANLNPNLPGSLLVIESLSNVNTVFNKGTEKYAGSLNQKMGYLEVPLELSYKVLDKKFGINIIGGMSTLILNQNEIFLQSTGMNLKIGEANNLSRIHFSGNLGLGFKYGFMKRLEASVEPVFKYQINTFSNNVGDFKPYIFGIYSGLSFSF